MEITFLKITFPRKEHNKMLRVWISVSCYGSTPLKLFVGLGGQASKKKKLQEN